MKILLLVLTVVLGGCGGDKVVADCDPWAASLLASSNVPPPTCPPTTSTTSTTLEATPTTTIFEHCHYWWDCE